MILKYFIIPFCAFFFIFSTQAFAVYSYAVGAGTTATIDEFGVCKDVTNSLGVGIMVPTKTANEWHTGGSSFLENLYAGVSVANCPLACSGTEVGGYCWYHGSGGGDSCDTVCATHGGVNMAGTKDYAGSGGTNANCDLVLDALTGNGKNTSTIVNARGCYSIGIGGNWRRGTTATTSTAVGASSNPANRACACNS